ncbi:MAG: gamma-butyrobetaine hydroxylase-like domain-containing protein [Anaerolineae bacterium]
MATTPRDIAVDLKQAEVRITWQDGHASAYSLEFLRANCPCAVCQKQPPEGGTDSPPAPAPHRAELDPNRPVEMVGQYALQFFWADGHRTGLYSYDYLRRLG